ncbi:MAG: hypothetical protein SF070_03520 [Gemmatimonadota bacterium]|nr:hypothetical protein [Gemmatimonadota bacterium]
MTMGCGQVRRLLWPDASPRGATPEVVDAQAHLAGCPDCRAFLAEMVASAGLLHRAAPRGSAPPRVRERLFRATARARVGALAPPRGGSRRALAGAAAALVLAAGLWRTATRISRNDPVAAFAEDHLRAAAGPGVRTTEAPMAVAWLRERLPFAIQVPEFPDGRVEGARLYLLAGRHGGVVQYRLGGHDLSYYVVPTDAALPAGAPFELRSAVQAGYRVVAWREGAMVHALVADLPEVTLRELARICIAQSVRAAAVRGSGEATLHAAVGLAGSG